MIVNKRVFSMEKIKLGISSCLLGEKVRYDGGHKLDRFLRDTLGKYVEYVSVCPEMECGLGVPRKSMHLEGNPDSPRLIITETGQDITKRMVKWAQKRVIQLEKENLRGFIFKSDSPSCGIDKVKVYNKKTMPVKTGAGIFAAIFIKHFPFLPVEDEESIHGKFNLDSNLSAVLRPFNIERTNRKTLKFIPKI
jgi:uncharacterized protein YbbK (DUF523 family)